MMWAAIHFTGGAVSNTDVLEMAGTRLLNMLSCVQQQHSSVVSFELLVAASTEPYIPLRPYFSSHRNRRSPTQRRHSGTRQLWAGLRRSPERAYEQAAESLRSGDLTTCLFLVPRRRGDKCARRTRPGGFWMLPFHVERTGFRTVVLGSVVVPLLAPLNANSRAVALSQLLCLLFLSPSWAHQSAATGTNLANGVACGCGCTLVSCTGFCATSSLGTPA